LKESTGGKVTFDSYTLKSVVSFYCMYMKKACENYFNIQVTPTNYYLKFKEKFSKELKLDRYILKESFFIFHLPMLPMLVPCVSWELTDDELSVNFTGGFLLNRVVLKRNYI